MLSLWHKTLFVHIPKCGGQSIENAFLNDIGLKFGEHRHLMLCLQKGKPFHGKPGPPKLAHLRARDYFEMDYISRELFDRLYRFSVVRNPFSRISSHWRYLFSDIDFREFVLERLPDLQQRQTWFYGTQYDFLHDEIGELLVEDALKLEDIDRGWPVVQNKANIAHPLQHKNKSRSSTTARWTEDMADAVRAYYAKDFEAFGYETATPRDRGRAA